MPMSKTPNSIPTALNDNLLSSHSKRVSIVECVMDPELDKGLPKMGKLLASTYVNEQMEYFHIQEFYQGKYCGKFSIACVYTPLNANPNYYNFIGSIYLYVTFYDCDQANSGITFRQIDNDVFHLELIHRGLFSNQRENNIYISTFLHAIDAFMQERANITGKVCTMQDDTPAQLLPEFERAGYTPVSDETAQPSTSLDLAPRNFVSSRQLQKQFFPQLAQIRDAVSRIVVDV